MSATSIGTGQQAPDLTLSDDRGTPVRLRDLVGRTVVLYFYPKDDTSGCTAQACSLRDDWSQFEGREDVVVYGVSPDSVERHQAFRAKYDLPFHLLVDEGHELADAFGIWVEKSMYGRKYWGVERSTVILDADGTVRTIRRKVKPAEHTAWLRSELGI